MPTKLNTKGGGSLQVIGMDVGRNEVKAVSNRKRVSFKSRVGEWRERRLTSGGDYEVQVDGKRYFIADLAEESFFAREMVSESKIHQETQILFLSALALVADPGEKAAIITGLPVAHHTTEGKEAMTDLLWGPHTVRVNGQFGAYVVDQIGIVPEGGGAYWDAILDDEGKLRNSWLAEQKVRVVDLGSRTVNYVTIHRRKYLDRDSGTMNYGMLELSNSQEESDDTALEQFTRRIAADLMKRWLNYRPQEDVVLLAGGGSILLAPWLQQHFPLAQFAEDPLFANAQGYRKMGVARWGEG